MTTLQRKYDSTKNQLLYFKQNSTPDFWDEHWKTHSIHDHLKKTISRHSKNLTVRHTQKYLPPKSMILEGGCGIGGNVAALITAGYEVIGIDYAERTVEAIRNTGIPIDVRKGDVRQLDFSDNFFDGYWSLGVIEHFFDGYEPIIEEAARVLRPGGFLFLTFPAMSRVRKLKAFLKLYPAINHITEEEMQHFYQFALHPQGVMDSLTEFDFEIIDSFYWDATKGLKDEIYIFKPLLQSIYDNKFPKSSFFKKTINKYLSSFCGHCICQTYQKQQ